MDFVYLKNVLLQFLEQKDRNHQKQLIPVLGMLLHFDRGRNEYDGSVGHAALLQRPDATNEVPEDAHLNKLKTTAKSI
ncbi:MAG: hypothetical protein Q9197_004198 [Variospora fuerteventurae]